MTNEELEKIETRAEAATPGPWMDRVDDSGFLLVCQKDGSRPSDGICGIGDIEETEPSDHFNAIFIAHARTDIPVLVTEIKRLRAIEHAAKDYLTADGPETYQFYQKLQTLCGQPSN